MQRTGTTQLTAPVGERRDGLWDWMRWMEGDNSNHWMMEGWIEGKMGDDWSFRLHLETALGRRGWGLGCYLCVGEGAGRGAEQAHSPPLLLQRSGQLFKLHLLLPHRLQESSSALTLLHTLQRERRYTDAPTTGIRHTLQRQNDRLLHSIQL